MQARFVALALTVALVSLAAPAAAQTLPAGGPSAAEMAEWLRTQGLDAAVRPGEDQVQSGANGVSWEVVGFDCEAARCRSWQFSAGFLLPALPEGAIADWNRSRRYLKGFEFQQPDGVAAVVQYDVLITPGMTWGAMTEHMHLFASVAPQFAVAMGVAAAPSGD